MTDRVTPEEQARAQALLKSPEAAGLSMMDYRRALMHAAGFMTNEEAREARRERRRQWGRSGARVAAQRRAAKTLEP